MKMSRKDERWAGAATSVALGILMLDVLLLAAGAACIFLGWSTAVGWVLIGLAVVLFLIAD